METFFLLTEIILVGFGLFGLTMLTNIWWAMVAGSVLGILAMEKALAARQQEQTYARVRAVAKKHLPGGRAA